MHSHTYGVHFPYRLIYTSSILERNRMRPLQDGYPDPTLADMLSRAMQVTLAMTPWQAVMATHQVEGMWPLAGDGWRRRRRERGERWKEQEE